MQIPFSKDVQEYLVCISKPARHFCLDLLASLLKLLSSNDIFNTYTLLALEQGYFVNFFATKVL
jgi:hypothetical protein